jgi:alkane 1-monooxygenase
MSISPTADIKGYNKQTDKPLSLKDQAWAQAKKYWYLITLIVPVFTILSALIAYTTNQGMWLWLLGFVFWIVIPLVDAWLREDPFNPSEEQEIELQKESGYYKTILYVATVLNWVGLATMTYVVVQGDWAWWHILGAVISVGALHAIGLTMSHELGHKMNDKTQVLFAKLGSACSGYAHFNIEHNKGHHKDVATPEDPASSRMGESIYTFVLREIPGAAKRGWTLEADRLKRQNRSIWSVHNELLQISAITFIGYATMIIFFGWATLPFLLVCAAYGWFQLTMANYIEHYGLLRQTLENGRYERCQPHHSWNNNFKASNLLTLHLQRHSDHHAHPTRAYQLLRDYADAPVLPQGYPAMMGLALCPPAWRYVMDKRVVKWANGDMQKVNIDPAKREQMIAKWGQPPIHP